MGRYINPFYLYGIQSFNLSKFFRYGFFGVKTIKSERIFYPMSWDRMEELKFHYGPQASLFLPKKLIWVWGFQIDLIKQIDKKVGSHLNIASDT